MIVIIVALIDALKALFKHYCSNGHTMGCAASVCGKITTPTTTTTSTCTGTTTAAATTIFSRINWLISFFFFSYLSKCDFIRVAVIQWPVQLLPVVISALPLPLSLVRALRQALLQLLPCVPANYHFVLLAVATVGKRYQRKKQMLRKPNFVNSFFFLVLSDGTQFWKQKLFCDKIDKLVTF